MAWLADRAGKKDGDDDVGRARRVGGDASFGPIPGMSFTTAQWPPSSSESWPVPPSYR